MTRAHHLLLFFASCTSDPPPLPLSQLMDPNACASCHAAHVDEWSGSMHAYASDDPVFVAMNARFQRDPAGASDPSFCVKCHAPVALQAGATTDGTNMATVDAKLHGITCYFCHTVSAVQNTHDQGLAFGGDEIMRGPITDPASGASHASAYSTLHDELQVAPSSSMCGSCHDVQNDHGVNVETTFAEWQTTIYAQSPNPSLSHSCAQCHMYATTGPAATTPGAPQNRRVHDHSLAAFDVALTSLPQAAAQRTLVQQFLDDSLAPTLCVYPPGNGPNVIVTLDNAFVGHDFPSGASHDRRVWVELVASVNGAPVLTSGDTVGDTQWLLRSQLVDESNQPVKFLWEAFGIQFDPNASPAEELPPSVTNDPSDPRYVHSRSVSFTPPINTDDVKMVVHATPIGADVLADLVASGDLDPSIPAAMPTFDLDGTKLEWMMSNGYGCVK